MTDLWRHSAIDLARTIAAGQVSSAEVVEAHLARIEAVNPKLNAIVRVLAEPARVQARAADAKVAAGEPLGPLHGVPITVKENIDMAGLPTTSGVVAMAQALVGLDAPVVQRMLAAGAIPIGRTNLPDMAMRVHTDSSLHGLTRNPWARDRTAGGSSGGEGAAIASGMSPLGLGNDIGGSLRNPATACGIASIRPSNGRVAHASVGPTPERLLATQFMAVQGPMARRVADVRLGLQILSGSHPRDPLSLDVPFAGPPEPGRIRVALVAAPPGGDTDPAIVAAVGRAADALADAGYEVVEVCPPRYEEAIDVWRRVLLGDLAAVMDEMAPLMGADGQAFLAAIDATVPPLADAPAFSRLLARRDGIAHDWSVFLADHPLVLSPAWTQPPFEHGFDVASPESSRAVMDLVRPVLPANLLGLPSACVPAGRDAATGLPIGVLLTGRRMRDDLCLDAAEAVEARLGLPTPIDPAW
ncbi:MAG TPA: amidase [Caulobacteraceae bacterium]|jgi:amidase|nr:amidase [Caulobacteraceae bacterium]